jgi:hypothetical protein
MLKAKPTPPQLTPQPTLHERITRLRAEIDALIDEAARNEHERIPGVPETMLRHCLTAGEPCRCAAYLDLNRKGVL